MKITPVLKCKDMRESLSFYTSILGFRLKDPSAAQVSPVVDLVLGEAEIQLSVLKGDSVFGCAINILVDDIDNLFSTLVQIGLDTSNRETSPVHQGPLNQTWGMREFYVDDPNGNTFRFRQPIH
jgi:catechol 2,3-dioxygenase-like lactoylglutathione lyase family enzyme